MAIGQQTHGGVLVVTVDAPAVRNALDREDMTALRDIFEGIAYREPAPPQRDAAGDGFRPRAVVLRSTGDVFSAGAHLGEMRRLGAADLQTNLSAALDMGAMFRAVRNCPTPVVARVQGPAYGGGVGLVAACDVVVAAPAARFAFSEVRLGLVPGVIAPLVMERMGAAAARTAFLLGETIAADAAERLGLVDRLAETDAALDAAVGAVVTSLLRGGPAALGRVKSLVDGAQTLGLARSAEFCARAIAEARTGAEGQAALAAFDAKQPPPWHVDDPWALPPAGPRETP
jgi:methylglutaconyl-CoA hydratase